MRKKKEMAKFNVVQKKKRAQSQEKKRRIHGDPVSGKLHLKQQPVSLSGKRKRKLEKKWRRDQKHAVEKGLITIEDVEMAATDSESKKASQKFSMKKSVRIKQAKNKGKKKGNSSKSASAAQASADVMVE